MSSCRRGPRVLAVLTYGAVGGGPAGQTFTVTVPVVARGVVGTVDAHLRALFAVVADRTNCKTDKRRCVSVKRSCKRPRSSLMAFNGHLDHSRVRCVQGGNRTLRSRGGSGTTGRRTGTTRRTGPRTCPLCILGKRHNKE